MDEYFGDPYITRILALMLEDGGFMNHRIRTYRPDVTAWAILLLNSLSSTSHTTVIQQARTRLTQDQQPDGSIPISSDQPHAIWPTPLSILAWHGSSSHRQYEEQAVQFLLEHTGFHMEKMDGNAIARHDTSIPGWPWIMHTHSWVQPTALSMIALSMNGHDTHERVLQSEQMLLDRQLPQGGWNYGNTTILGQELQAFPESTGLALSALSGRIPQTTVQQSLNYLLEALPRLRTPISLCWGVLGLQAWNMAPQSTESWLRDCLKSESRYGEYDPASLCLLLGTMMAQGGIKSLAASPESIYSIA